MDSQVNALTHGALHTTCFVPAESTVCIHQGSKDLAKTLTQLFYADCRGHDAQSPLDSYRVVVVQQSA